MRSPNGGVAVLISRHGCIMDPCVRKSQAASIVRISDRCIGCRKCTNAFECPALIFDEEGRVALVDRDRCIGCGTCIPVCPVDAIGREES
jgi:indolepyruvate ferredoxin oxidoreductase alpha subunit